MVEIYLDDASIFSSSSLYHILSFSFPLTLGIFPSFILIPLNFGDISSFYLKYKSFNITIEIIVTTMSVNWLNNFIIYSIIIEIIVTVMSMIGLGGLLDFVYIVVHKCIPYIAH